MKALTAAAAPAATIFDDGPPTAPAEGPLVQRWRACCAALFGFGAPPPGEVKEQTLFDTEIMPLLWPPY